MYRLLRLVALVVLCGGPLRAGDGLPRKQTVPVRKALGAEEIDSLRSVSRALLQLKKKHGAATAAVKRAQAAERKQLRERMSGAESNVRAKAISDMMRMQRKVLQKMRLENKKETDKFNKANPGAEKAYKELLYSGVAVEAPASRDQKAGEDGAY